MARGEDHPGRGSPVPTRVPREGLKRCAGGWDRSSCMSAWPIRGAGRPTRSGRPASPCCSPRSRRSPCRARRSTRGMRGGNMRHSACRISTASSASSSPSSCSPPRRPPRAPFASTAPAARWPTCSPPTSPTPRSSWASWPRGCSRSWAWWPARGRSWRSRRCWAESIRWR